jgi:hypothetical protein
MIIDPTNSSGWKLPGANSTLSELAESAERVGAEIMSLSVSDYKLAGRTFTVAVAFDESAKYLQQCVSEHNEAEEFELDGGDY